MKKISCIFYFCSSLLCFSSCGSLIETLPREKREITLTYDDGKFETFVFETLKSTVIYLENHEVIYKENDGFTINANPKTLRSHVADLENIRVIK